MGKKAYSRDYLLSKNLGKPLFEEDLEDLYQAGRTGMISAIRNYVIIARYEYDLCNE